jgi:hypothetical protein
MKSASMRYLIKQKPFGMVRLLWSHALWITEGYPSFYTKVYIECVSKWHNGMSMEAVSKMLGHTSLFMTRKYVKVDEYYIAQETENIRKLFSKKGWKEYIINQYLIIMKGGGTIFPNKGVKIDPRALTSLRMPESLKGYSGYLYKGFNYLLSEGILTRAEMEREYHKIHGLLPFQETKNKLRSSHFFHSKTYIIEFFRTSSYNYKVYAMRIAFPEEANSVFK